FVSDWITGIGLDPHVFGTHSLRRTKATLIYRRTGNLRAVQLLLGHTKIGEYGEIPRYRGRRRPCHRGRGRHLKIFGQSGATLPVSSNGAILAEGVYEYLPPQ